MGGSKGSSVATSSERNLPMCGCKEVMRLWIANTAENPKRKFWRCTNWGTNESCKLFVWDDKLDIDNVAPLSSKASGRCNCSGMVKEFAKEHAKEFAKEFAKECVSKKVEKLKKKVVCERSRVNWLVVAFLVSCVFFSVLHKFASP